jgi:hypothetical protein
MSKADLNRATPIDKTHVVQRQLHDKRFGEVTLLRNKTTQDTILQKEKVF